jgi:hypothetical protein
MSIYTFFVEFPRIIRSRRAESNGQLPLPDVDAEPRIASKNRADGRQTQVKETVVCG